MLKEAESMIQKWFDGAQENIIKISEDIWHFAEVKFEEVKSSQLLMDTLSKAGFKITAGVAQMPTAFVAEWSNGAGPVIGVIGEYDALPGVGCEIADTYKPTGTSGHGCGHNLIGTASMSAVLAAQHIMKQTGVTGTLKFFGCPAEEGGGAKVFMVRDGVFDGLDAAIGWHPANATNTTMASPLAIYSVRFTFHGISSHAGTTPYLGRSALDAAILMDVGVNYLREHVPSDVRIHSVITNGGTIPNIVPDKAEIWYYLRAPRRTDVDQILERVKKIAHGMAMATETTVEVHLGTGSSSNGLANKALSKAAFANLKTIGGPQFTKEEWAFAANLNREVSLQDKLQSMRGMYRITDTKVASLDLYEGVADDMLEGVSAPYSGDTSDVSWQVPYCQYSVACQTVGTGNHSWQQVVCSGMGIGQKGMIVAGKAMALSVYNFLVDKDLMKAAKEEFDEQLRLYPYSCPIAPELRPGEDD